jgi:3-hydroxybutyryl-CoA dehydratase
MRVLEVGQVLVHERCFTDEDVVAFQRISGDGGRHHAQPDATGRRIVHGLLTASIATKIGGDLDYWAREMIFEFRRPVFTGDTIRCTLTIVELVPESGRVGLTMVGACHDQHGKEVLRISTRGVVLDDAS